MTPKVSVFVSSTCYDLGAIRHELHRFVTSLGYVAYLSDHASFPIDPSSTNIDNCLRNVRENADLFVLVVGTRYGSTDDRGRSITNLEYIQAKAIGIPVYVFVLQGALTQIDIWKANPSATFPGVDSTKVFEFISQLKSEDGMWVFPFNTVDDITSVLRDQWAYLFRDSLRLKQKMSEARLPPSLSSLSGEALRLVVDRPAWWEYRLFGCVLETAFHRARSLRLDWELGASIGPTAVVEAADVFGLVNSRIEDLLHIIEVFGALFSPAQQEAAFGPPGVSGDAERIVHFANRVGGLYESMLEWSLSLRRIRTDPRIRPLIDHIAAGITQAIGELERFHTDYCEQIRELVHNPPKENETREITLNVTLEMPPGFAETQARLMRDIAADFGIDPDIFK